MTRNTGAPRAVWLRRFAALALGALTVPAYAPLGWYPLALVSLAALAWLVCGALDVRRAAALGYAYGLGLFTAGIGWIYIALHQFGGMPGWLAAPVTLVFAGYLALYPAAACAIARALPASRRWWGLAAAWALTEWLRGWVFTGFPWLAVGYSQVPASPLAGLAPVLGVFGVSGATVLAAAALAQVLAWQQWRAGLATLALLAAAGLGLGRVAWTEVRTPALPVTLVQGNVAQDMKFREETLVRTLSRYAEAVENAGTRLVILPETALPLFLHEIPAEYLARLTAAAKARGGDAIVGVFDNAPPGSDRYYNAVMSLGSAPVQHYRKDHLVPFGEFIPFKRLLAPVINDWLHIPLSDQTRGGTDQKPLEVAGERVAMNICYEDVFGEEIIRQLPGATVLANVSNDAWYGRSWAAEQHLQISQTRALETGRWMLRATNTGVTAVIDPHGVVRAQLPQFREEVLVAEVEGRTGATPYVRTGNWAVAGLSIAALAVAARPGRRKPRAVAH
jgi:apolipoprotein N-acyltransferase